MMPIAEEELSGYLDGELTPARRAAVDQALAGDLHLRTVLEALQGADLKWRGAARGAAFVPKVHWHGVAGAARPATMAAALAGLLLVRILPKLDGAFALGLLLQAIALAAIVAWVVSMARRSPTADAAQTA